MDQKIKYDQNTKERTFSPKEEVWIRNFLGDPKWIPGVVVSQQGPLSYRAAFWWKNLEKTRRAFEGPKCAKTRDITCTDTELHKWWSSINNSRYYQNCGYSWSAHRRGEHRRAGRLSFYSRGEAGPPSVQLPAEVPLVANDKEELGTLRHSQNEENQTIVKGGKSVVLLHMHTDYVYHHICIYIFV